MTEPRRESWREMMRSESGRRPLLDKGGQTIDVDEYEPDEIFVPSGISPGEGGGVEEFELQWVRNLAMEVDRNKFENLDESMRATVKLDFDNRCFTESGRQIDYVLAYEEEDEDPVECAHKAGDMREEEEGEEHESDATKRRRRRQYFHENLKAIGLQLTEVKTDPTIGRTVYVLVHAPFPVLERQAQLLNVKLPMKKCDVEHSGRTLMPGCIDRCLDRMEFLDFPPKIKLLLDEPDYYTAPYSTDRRHNFVMWNMPEHLFPSAERSRLVYDLLVRARYRSKDAPDDEKYRVGIERLLANGTYTGAYPLHQELRSREEMAADGSRSHNQRELLYTCWASWRAWYKYQPLDLIKRYFGSKIGLYFAWLGYYTKTLYPAAIMGLICVTFGIIQFTKDPVSISICNDDKVGGRIITCPACNDYCDFQYLNSSCVYAKVSYLFDNTMTVVFAALMSVWASLFLEGWKRYHAEVAWKWGLFDYAVEEDTVRPEFQHRVKTTKWNPVTGKDEPYLSKGKRLANFLASAATVLFFVFLVLGVVFGVVVYRVICLQLLAKTESPTVDKFAFIIVTATAATLNLIVILIMNYVYYFLALILTRWECPRTQNDFDNSFTMKVFLFQFVNYYSSLFYIAFFKGLLAQLPAFQSKDKTTGGALQIGGTRLEGCDPAGCFAELVIQLAIIMCGRQFFSAFVEVIYPVIMGGIRRWQFLLPASKREEKERKKKVEQKGAKRWEDDYFLSPTYEQWLFDEYLEMVIQFGFITLFVAAFPLAPVFALINNILEIRLDAYKFLVTTQRPMPAQSRNIGIWLNILQFLSTISVTINALVIAFTSDFVPKSYYMYYHDGDLKGYIDWSLSHFDTRNMVIRNSDMGAINVTDCRFRGYRKLPCDLAVAPETNLFKHSMIRQELNDTCDVANSYGFSEEWWKILALRLVFVVVFEHVVFLIKMLVDYMIPDVPTKIFLQQQREKYLARKAALEDISSRQGSVRRKSDKNDTSGAASGRPLLLTPPAFRRGVSAPASASSSASYASPPRQYYYPPSNRVYSRISKSGDVDEVAFQPGEFGVPYPYRHDSPDADAVSFATASEGLEETTKM